MSTKEKELLIFRGRIAPLIIFILSHITYVRSCAVAYSEYSHLRAQQPRNTYSSHPQTHTSHFEMHLAVPPNADTPHVKDSSNWVSDGWSHPALRSTEPLLLRYSELFNSTNSPRSLSPRPRSEPAAMVFSSGTAGISAPSHH